MLGITLSLLANHEDKMFKFESSLLRNVLGCISQSHNFDAPFPSGRLNYNDTVRLRNYLNIIIAEADRIKE